MTGMHSVIVIGGGIAGIQASLDLADQGITVYLVEKSPSIGGRMAQLDKTFPTMDCSICILAPKMIDCYRHPNIKLLTYCEIKEVSGSAGNFTVKVLKKPRYIDEEKCTGCGTCIQKCPINVPNEFEMGLGVRKAIYLPFPQAVPRITTIDKDSCLYFQKGVCRVCEKFCQAGAIDFDQKPEEIELKVAAVIVATGFALFDPSEIKEYGYQKYKNVITALEFERLACASGPTGGKLLRPSDQAEPHVVAFVQCIGSRSLRDDYGHQYCSYVCCMHATKEAILVKEHNHEADVYVFYKDLRAFGKGFQEFVNRAEKEYGIKYINAGVGKIFEDPVTKNLQIRYEDISTAEVQKLTADLVVLCPALISREDNKKIAGLMGLELDEHGFFKSADELTAPVDTNVSGIYVCGCCQSPKDISESVTQASGAAARAAETITICEGGIKT